MKVHYLDKYLRNCLHPISILLVGAGGTGSAVLNNLVRLHTTLIALGGNGLKVTLCDMDTISEANIGRQSFFPQDIGRFKADVLIERVNRTFGTEWLSYSNPIENYPGLANITISCTDSVESRKVIQKRFKENKSDVPQNKSLYWIDCGNLKFTGQVIMGSQKIKQPEQVNYETTDKLKTILDLYPDLKDVENVPSCSVSESLSRQDLLINSFIANFGVQMLWQLLRYQYIDYNGLFFNLADMEIKRVEL